VTSKSDCRVVLKDGDKLYRLFSVMERRNGDLVISLNTAEFYRKIGSNLSGDDPKINNQKYSVHRSLKSPTNINAIVHTLNFDNGEEKRTSHYTKAIKQNNNFAPILLVRCPDLSATRYLTNNDRCIITLDDYHHSSSLYYNLVIGPLDFSFDEYCEDDINFRTINFTHFSLSILWSYDHLLPNHTGAKAHALTFPDENSPQMLNTIYQLENGLSAIEIIDQFRRIRGLLHFEFASLINNIHPDLNDILPDLVNLGFVKRKPEKHRAKHYWMDK